MQSSDVQSEPEDRRSPESPDITDQSATEREDRAPDAGGDQAELSPDDIFGILSNPRRRAAVRYLTEQEEETVQLRDLAERLAAWENDVDPEAVTYKQRKRVYTSLYQSHLSKMDDAGVVTFDKPRGTVERTELTGRLEDYLDATREGREWERVSLAAAVLCLAAVALARLGPLGFPAETGIGLATAVALVFFAVSAAQALDRR